MQGAVEEAMRNTVVSWALRATGAVALAALQAACIDLGCDADATCRRFVHPGLAGINSGSGGGSGAGGEAATGSGDGTGGACPDDPAEGGIADECAIWVRASAPGDDTNPGTPAAPVRTIAKAIALAQAGPLRIYACGETFVEHVALPAGVSLFGGFDCQDDWRYRGVGFRATLAPGVPGMTALTLLDGLDKSFVGDLVAQSADAVEPGGSSIAVFVREHANAHLRRSEVIAGDGADGADGADGDHNGIPAQAGLAGNDGADACTLVPGLGGGAVALQCDDGNVSTSGYGGNGGEQAATDGGDGEAAPNPNPLAYGLGGSGENAAAGMACTPGFGGAQGADGTDGLGAIGDGKLTADGQMSGVPGGAGTPGVAGQAGGGGGGSMAKGLCGAAPPAGAGGGAGGTGGCGGKGGKGGQAGGSSIGIAVHVKDFRAYDVHITTGQAGRGGKGGVLQPGGQSGLPGLGGKGMVNGVKGGCGGGVGGQGGKGGNGGGGHGGHSACIAFTALADAPVIDRPGCYPGIEGKGGKSGNPNGSDGTGDPGIGAPSVIVAK